jgi:hypothetical protein
VPLIELNEQKDEWLVAIKVLQEKKKESKENDKNRKEKKDLVFGQYTNAYKLSGNWN